MMGGLGCLWRIGLFIVTKIGFLVGMVDPPNTWISDTSALYQVFKEDFTSECYELY